MSKGISIHIGLNHVDPDAYDGWNGQLDGCINDARAMKKIADQQGYQSTMLIDDQATSDAVIENIAQAAQALSSGDMFLLTYSGHGGQIDDINGDEEDGKDETWVLYDRMLIDDELYSLWGQFEAGVRIFMLSDSCHSGTVAKMRSWQAIQKARQASMPPGRYRANGSLPKIKAIPQRVQNKAYLHHQRMYNTLQWAAGRGDRATIGACVALISGCLDNQESGDSPENGTFTAQLLDVWADGAFSGDYEKFWKDILREMPPEQSPNFYTVGASDPQFLAQKPFVIGDATQQGGGSVSESELPSIRPRRQWLHDSQEGPTCQIITGENRYYIVEAFTDPILADQTDHGDDRQSDNFYATYNDPNMPRRLTASTFELPADAWARLKQPGGRIYFRIGTTSGPTGWDNYTVSTSDLEGDKAPFVEVVGEMEPEGPGGGSPPMGADTLTFPSGEEFEVVSLGDVDDGIDYSDPTAQGAVQLIRVADRMNDQLSANFQVKEFVDDRNSRYARISPELVEKLQEMRNRAGRLDIQSGYRHPAFNRQVGGASKSRHLAGDAVEISSPTLTPLELSELALDVLGCNIGLGLGPDFIGFDLRGSQASWVESGADLSGQQFREWVDQQCLTKDMPVKAKKGEKLKAY
jgi:hypothetical protein